ncbi:dual specificity phosphatase 19 [Bulinus truncatus]|nr:dual specificity phosphatase 19 [Bulinus truncatus]
MAGHGVKPSPLNLTDLKQFDKNALRKTETLITNTDGSRVIEGKDEQGNLYRRPSSSSQHGFVVDWSEDLQVAEVREGLLMGSQDVAHDLDTLRLHGVTHILNVASGIENLFPDLFTYLSLEFRDLPEFPIIQGFQKAINFIDDARKANGCVLVHCNAGISRSAAVVMAYLIKTERMTVNEAFSFLRSKRPAICPNPGFMIQLQNFYDNLYANTL